MANFEDFLRQTLNKVADKIDELNIPDKVEKLKHEISDISIEEYLDQTKENIKRFWEEQEEQIPEKYLIYFRAAKEGAIGVPTDNFLNELTQEIKKRKKLKDLKVTLSKGKIQIDFIMEKLVPLKGQVILELKRTSINKEHQVLIFKTDKPIHVEFDNVPEEIMAGIAAMISISLDDKKALNKFVPPQYETLKEKDGDYIFDLNRVPEFIDWKNKKILGKTILDFIEFRKIEIHENQIKIYPRFAFNKDGPKRLEAPSKEE